MTTFDQREQAAENKFAHDEEIRFRIHARRSKLFGLWVAEKLGRTDAAAETYAKELVLLDFEKHGDLRVLDKVAKDLGSAGQNVSAAMLQTQLTKLYETARQQIMSE